MTQQSFYVFAIKIVILGLGFLNTLLVAKMLPIFEMGEYIFFISTVMLLCFFIDFGCNSAFFKSLSFISVLEKTAQVDEKVRLFSFKLTAILLINVVCIICALSIQKGEIVLFGLASSFLSMQLSSSTVNRAEGAFVRSQVGYELLPNIIRVVPLGGIWFFNYSVYVGLDEVLFLYVVSLLVPFFYFLFSNLETFKRVSILNYDKFMDIIKANSGLAWVGLLLYAHTQLDVILLKVFSTEEDVAGYGIANRLASLFAFSMAVANVLVPSYIGQQLRSMDYLKLKKFVLRFSLLMLIVCCAQLLVLIFLGERIMLLWGDAYLTYFTVVLILCLSQAFYMLFGVSSHLLFLGGRQRVNTITESIGFILNLVANLLLIPTYGAVGAAVGTAVCLFLVNVIKVIAAWSCFSRSRLEKGLKGL